MLKSASGETKKFKICAWSRKDVYEKEKKKEEKRKSVKGWKKKRENQRIGKWVEKEE